MKTREIYFLFSGKGEYGTWEIVDTDDISKVLNKERCNGDRWAKAYPAKTAYITEYDEVIADDCETGESAIISDDNIIEYMRDLEELEG